MKISNKKISVIVCTIEEDPLTVKSIPAECEILIADWKSKRKGIWPRSIARNMKAVEASGEVLVFMDGDISFSEDFFKKLVHSVGKKKMTGIKCPWKNFLLSRVMAIRKTDFFAIGGFCPVALFMEDIDFTYKAEKVGYDVVYFPAESVFHKQHPSNDKRTFPQYLRTEIGLAFKFPRYFKLLPRRFVEFFYHRIMKPREKK